MRTPKKTAKQDYKKLYFDLLQEYEDIKKITAIKMDLFNTREGYIQDLKDRINTMEDIHEDHIKCLKDTIRILEDTSGLLKLYYANGIPTLLFDN